MNDLWFQLKKLENEEQNKHKVSRMKGPIKNTMKQNRKKYCISHKPALNATTQVLTSKRQPTMSTTRGAAAATILQSSWAWEVHQFIDV